MFAKKLLGLLLVGMVAAFGCDRQDTTATGVEGTQLADDAAQQARDAAAEAQDAAGIAVDAARDATDAAADATAAVADQAQKLLDQAVEYIKENRLELAEQTINQLEGMRDSLSPTLQSGLEQAKQALADAKRAAGQ